MKNLLKALGSFIVGSLAGMLAVIVLLGIIKSLAG